MPRFNKIYAGPVTEVTPQVQERICAAAVLPGIALVESGSAFAIAGANSGDNLPRPPASAPSRRRRHPHRPAAL